MQHHIHPNRLGRHMHKTNHVAVFLQQKKGLLFISKYKDTSLAFNALLLPSSQWLKMVKKVPFEGMLDGLAGKGADFLTVRMWVRVPVTELRLF